MNVAQRLAVLEALVMSDAATPAERIRALELLAGLDSTEGVVVARDELSSLSDSELDAELDASIGERIVQAALDGSGWPTVGAAIQREIEHRARELAPQRRD